MADINLVTPNKVEVVESFIQMTLPAAEPIVAGAAVRLDVAAGRFTNANAGNAGEARIYGIATRSVIAGQAVTAIRKGVMDGWVFDALAYDADVFLSNNDGRIADVAGVVNVVIGRVIPANNVLLGTAYDKLLFLDL
jgi:hypothetical protein